jgi:hypothetical protein
MLTRNLTSTMCDTGDIMRNETAEISHQNPMLSFKGIVPVIIIIMYESMLKSNESLKGTM